MTASLNAEKAKTGAKVKIIDGLKAKISELQNDTAKLARSEYKLQQKLAESRQRPVGHPSNPTPLQTAASAVITEVLAWLTRHFLNMKFCLAFVNALLTAIRTHMSRSVPPS